MLDLARGVWPVESGVAALEELGATFPMRIGTMTGKRAVNVAVDRAVSASAGDWPLPVVYTIWPRRPR